LLSGSCPAKLLPPTLRDALVIVSGAWSTTSISPPAVRSRCADVPRAWQAGFAQPDPVPGIPPSTASRWAMDDQTAITVTDSSVDVLSEGHWRLITPSAESQKPMQLTRIP
jgi:hypothetical protein